MYDEQKNEFKNTLLKNVFLTRGLKEKLGIGSDILTKNEWTLLSQNFADLINQGIEQSAEAKQAVETLKQSGIPMSPDSLPKWLLWALLGVVGFAGVGVVKGVRSAL